MRLSDVSYTGVWLGGWVWKVYSGVHSSTEPMTLTLTFSVNAGSASSTVLPGYQTQEEIIPLAPFSLHHLQDTININLSLQFVTRLCCPCLSEASTPQAVAAGYLL